MDVRHAFRLDMADYLVAHRGLYDVVFGVQV
jgi:hypothetical protein